VRGTRPDETGSFGQGVAVLSGGDLQLERAALVGNHHVAVSVDASSARLSDVAVVGTELEPVTGSFGRAISAQSGGQVHAERVALDENHEAAVLSADDGTLVTLTDAVIRGTILAPIATGGGGSSGDGVIVRFGAAAELSRVWLDDESLVGIGVAEEGSRLTARDVVLEGTEADEAGFFGQGLLVERGASAELERAVIARSPHIGVSIEGVGSTLSLRDVLVRDGLGQPADGLFGRGLNVQDGAAVTLERAALASNRDVSIFVGGEGATLRGSDVTVTDTARRACAPGCSEAGVGIGAYVGGLIDLRAFAVRRAALTGVQVARDGAMDLHDGEIAESPIGANVQVDDYDLTRLQDGVAYRDNDRNLDAATLPVPDFEAGHP